MDNSKQLYDAAGMDEAIRQIAGRIAADCAGDPRGIALVGIQQMGVPLAEKLCSALTDAGVDPEFGKLDITMYRDDFGKRSGLPLIRETVIPFDLNGENIILVDDVLSSGRTIRAALDALTDYGRPALIRLAVLVDRGEPEFPIRADFVGFSNNSPAENKIVVQFDENGLPGGVYERKWNQ